MQDLARRLEDIQYEMAEVQVPFKQSAQLPSPTTSEPLIVGSTAVDEDTDHVHCYDDCEVTDSDGSQGEMSDSDEHENLTQCLSNWVLTYGIPHIALTALLAILSFLKTQEPSFTQELSMLLRNCAMVCTTILELNQPQERHCLDGRDTLVAGSCLKRQINIDGLPLFKSSSLQLWPILGLSVTISMNEPVVIGLFLGTKKPDSCAIFLEDFVTELPEL